MSNQNSKINPRLLQGFRDFLPQKKMQRDWLIEKVRTVYELFGFQPLETPVLEYADILLGKYGDEANMLMYKFKDNGGREVALRYDMTIPFSRVIAQYPELPKPFKRYQVGPVWRADSPQQGRYREFYQFDADIAGSSSIIADAEIVFLISTVMKNLSIRDFQVKLNNRKILNGLIEISNIDNQYTNQVFQAIDKLEKIGLDAVIEIISGKSQDSQSDFKITDKSISTILKFLSIKGTNQEVLSQLKILFKDSQVGIDGVEELSQVLMNLDVMGMIQEKIQIDLSIARGLDYYTGTIFETNLLQLPNFGSVFSGGRYDTLIGMFTGKDTPAVGASVGVDRLFSAMEELKLLPLMESISQVMITVFPENPSTSMLMATKLRDAGIKCEVYLGDSKSLKSQLKQANKQNIPFVVITFPDQIEKNVVIIKNMLNGNQVETNQANLIATIQKML